MAKAERNKRTERAKNEVARQGAPKNEENVRTKQSSSKIEPSLKAEVVEEKHSFPVVGVGASAGGLEAYNELLENLPLNTGMAFVFIQHLMSGQESMLTDILSRSTKMPVLTAKNNMQVQPNKVYVIPPDVNMTIEKGVLKLQPKISTQYRPVDQFLISLAWDLKNLAIGVILSGTGTDGTEGVKAIHAEGGITFAQDEESAKYPGMPHSAASSGTIHFVLQPKKIAEELTRIGRHPQLNRSELKIVEAEVKEDSFRSILALLKLAFDVDFAYYKETTVMRRISRRMVIHKVENIDDYVKFIRGNKSELQALLDDMLIGVTSFFREPETFEILKSKVFPIIVKDKSAQTPIRIWVPGCSTGEEVYSVAIALKEFMEDTHANSPTQIFGTDVNERNINKARAGVYPENITASVSEHRLNHFFSKVDKDYQVNKSIREMCIFAKQDLTKDPPFSNLDMVSCRNVLIYFKPVMQKKIIPMFHYALKPKGYLVLGNSESIGAFEDLFSPFDKGPVYSKKMAPSTITFGLEPLAEFRKKEVLKKAPIVEKPLSLLQTEVEHTLTTRFVPPSVLVNKDMEILAFRGNTNPYLEPSSGEASLNLMKMLKLDLRLELQTLFFRVKKEKVPLRREGIQFEHNGSSKTVDVEIMPVSIPESEETFFLILFEPTEVAPVSRKGPKKPIVAVEGEKERQIEALQRELGSTKESLQTIIEEQEATNEELRAALEEVQSTNEELQSTNEELETAREELQSTNEELNTLNEELANRNRALSQAVNDLNNLFTNTNLAIFILDLDLRVRLFTPLAEKMFNITPADMGRSINDFKRRIDVPDLEKLIHDVIDNLTSKEREIQDESGHWYLMRIRPYMTTEKKIDGTVLSFVDIDAHVRSRKELAKERDILKGIMENTSTEMAYFDADFNIVAVNSAFAESSGHEVDELVGKNHFALFPEPENQAIFERVRNTGEPVAFFDKPFLFVGQSEKGPTYWDWTLAPVKDGEGRVQWLILSLFETTQRKKAEEALRKAHDELEIRVEERTRELHEASLYARSLIEASPDPLVTISADGKITDVNKATEDVTGASREQLVGSDFSDYFTEPGKAKEGYGKVLSEGFVKDYSLSIRHKSGKITDVLYNATLYKNEAGEIQGIFAAARDITERKRAEEALREVRDELEIRVEERTKELRESQHDLNRAQAVARTGSWRLDVQRNVLLWSDETYDMFGIRRGTTLTYESFLSYVHPDDRDYVDQSWKAALQGEHYDIEHKIVVNGEVKWVREKAELEFGENQVLLGAFGTVQDITERKLREDELSSARSLLAKELAGLSRLQETSIRFVSTGKMQELFDEITNSATDITEADMGTLQLLSDNNKLRMVSQKGFNQSFLDFFNNVNADSHAVYAEALRSMKRVTVEDVTQSPIFIGTPALEVQLQAGVRAVQSTPLFTRSGKILGVISTHYRTPHRPDEANLKLLDLLVRQAADFVERTQNEQKIDDYARNLEKLVEERTRQLKDAERLSTIGATAGMVGHDIRNPLQSIEGAVYLAKEELKSLPESSERKELEEIVELIQGQADYIDHIVGDLQDFARTPTLHCEETNIAEFVNQSLSSIKIPEDIRVRVEAEENIEKLMVDPMLMKRVILNLAQNAVQAMPKGGELTVKIRCDEKTAYFCVADTGIGIREEDKPKLFTPLFTTKAKGQGFGLAVCKKFVEAHSGEITVESEVGKGSTFTVKLPITEKTGQD